MIILFQFDSNDCLSRIDNELNSSFYRSYHNVSPIIIMYMMVYRHTGRWQNTASEMSLLKCSLQRYILLECSLPLYMLLEKSLYILHLLIDSRPVNTLKPSYFFFSIRASSFQITFQIFIYINNMNAMYISLVCTCRQYHWHVNITKITGIVYIYISPIWLDWTYHHLF